MVLLDHLNADKEVKMKIDNDELIFIVGGFKWNGTIINALTRVVNSVVDVGRYIGSALRRMTTNNYCIY